MACQIGNEELVKYLIKHKKKLGYQYNVLCEACYYNNVNIVKRLINYRLNVNSGYDNKNPLYKAEEEASLTNACLAENVWIVKCYYIFYKCQWKNP